MSSCSVDSLFACIFDPSNPAGPLSSDRGFPPPPKKKTPDVDSLEYGYITVHERA